MTPGDRHGSIQNPVLTFLPVLIPSLFGGVPVYFFAFLFAYGFRDTIGWGNHLTFLAAVAVFATACGLPVLLAAEWEPVVNTRELFAFGIQSAWALNALAVGIGSIVSADHKAEGSVSADFSTTTDVVVATALFGIAAFFTWRAYRLTAR